MTYTVYVKEISYGCIEVEADTYLEAQEQASEDYINGDIYWYDSTAEFNEKEVK